MRPTKRSDWLTPLNVLVLTKQIRGHRGRSLKSKSRVIQTECRQPYSFRFPSIAKLRFKRVKYISIRREKSLTQRGNNVAILKNSDRLQVVVTRVVTILMGGFWLAGCFGTRSSRGALENEPICLLSKNLASYKFVFLIVHERSCRKAIYHSKKGSVASFTTVGSSTKRPRGSTQQW